MAGEREALHEIPHTASPDYCMGKPDHEPLPAEVQAAAKHLQRAYEYAPKLQVDVWELAVPLRHLVELGVQESDLRWLVVKGYAEHAHEITTSRDVDRRFRPSRNISFTPETCFVLTAAGAGILCGAQEEASLPASAAPMPKLAVFADPVPHWDRRMRTLYFGHRIVKRFRQPAANQETVLAALEQEGWTHVIDDPLPPVDSESPSEMRLRDTIRRLNLNQVNHLLHFYGDGSGLRVGWEAVAATTLPLEIARQKARRAA